MGAGLKTPGLRRAPRLGISRKTGDLMRLAGGCRNGEACGLIRQSTGNLTSCCGRRHGRRRLGGTAWLPPARASRCGVKSSYERNPHPAMRGAQGRMWRKASQYGLHRLGYTRAAQPGTQGSQRASVRQPPKPGRFGTRPATRPCEAVIVSNHKSKRCGEGNTASAHTAHHARRGASVLGVVAGPQGRLLT
jgi:hypothetical protein